MNRLWNDHDPVDTRGVEPSSACARRAREKRSPQRSLWVAATWSTAWTLLFLFVVGLTAQGCGGGAGNKLQGSLDDYYDLHFVETRARLYSSQLSVEWVDDDKEVVMRGTINVAQVNLEGPATLDLALYGDLTGVSNRVPLPQMVSGTMVLEAYAPTAGAPVEGTLDAELKGQNGNSSVHGAFRTVLEDLR